MASPADSSGRNAPRTCLIRMDPALAPALFLMVATSAVETVLSAVTTTRSAAPSTYHAMPRIPDCSTAWRAVESWPLLLWRVGAEGAAGRVPTERDGRARGGGGEYGCRNRRQGDGDCEQLGGSGRRTSRWKGVHNHGSSSSRHSDFLKGF